MVAGSIPVSFYTKLFIAFDIMDPSNPKILYTVGYSLYKTPDATANNVTWTNLTGPIATSGNCISVMAIDPLSTYM